MAAIRSFRGIVTLLAKVHPTVKMRNDEDRDAMTNYDQIVRQPSQ
jgi:hypothetical protein